MKTQPDRSALARIAAHSSWARTPDRAERTEPARRSSPGRVEYWLDRVDPSGVMSEAARLQAAESAVRAHMSGLRLKRTRKAQDTA